MKEAEILLFPPVAFTIFLLVGFLLLWLGKSMAATGKHSSGKRTPYACGEEVSDEKLQPDYSYFFPFALFFTIIHVAALMLATLPGGQTALLGIVYLAGVAIALYTLIVR